MAAACLALFTSSSKDTLAQQVPPPVEPPGAVTLVPAGGVWRYLDDGSPAPEGWNTSGFDDAAWRFGPAQLGYGDGDESTVVSYGPQAAAKFVTTRFRRTFEVVDAAVFARLIVSLVRDDGAVVYLNGVELIRDNLPDGPISNQTLALSAVGEDENQVQRYELPPTSLATGRNVLAVEVHQSNPSSSDLSFDLQLAAVLAGGELVPQVAIRSTVPETTEPSPTTRVRPAEFTLIRTGSDFEPLILFVEYGGTARAGEDYAELPQFQVMPRGESSLTLRIEPKEDSRIEGDETVVARLAIPPINSLPNYHLDPASSEARVVIHDREPASPRLEIVEPRDGANFEAGEIVPLRAVVAGDLSGRAWSVEFFDGDQSIGSSQAGATFWWQEASGGRHVLTARTLDPATGVALSAEPVIIDVGPGPTAPVVRVWADAWRTGEPCPTCFVAPGVLVVQRTDPAGEPLTVFLGTDGTAASGPDYEALPDRVVFSAGQKEIRLNLLARDDLLVEGPEVVRVRLLPAPLDSSPRYLVAPSAGEALLVIFDDEPDAPAARLDLVDPISGTRLPAGTSRSLTALGVFTEGEIQSPVEFYAGDRLVGRSQPFPFARPTIAGWPSAHRVVWTNPPPGIHRLVARTELAPDHWLSSPPVSVTVDPLPSPAVVGLVVDDPVAVELNPGAGDDPARFRVTRTGDTSHPLLVFYSVHGSAQWGLDYPALTGFILLPAAETSASLVIAPTPDGQAEGMETIHIRLEPSPLTDPFSAYEISAARDDVAVILDSAAGARPAVEIVSPEDGDRFGASATVPVLAAAFHPDQDLFRVEFHAGDQQIGESVLVLDRLSSGGLLVHRFAWTHPPAGDHTLTALAFAEGSAEKPAATSPPVHLRVEADPEVPVLWIEATQPIAEESSEPYRRLPRVGEFTISRSGPTDQALPVFVHYSGFALPGTDYKPLPWVTTIPAGAGSTTLRVEPAPDRVSEGIETVVATLSDCPPNIDPPVGMPCLGGFRIDPGHGQAMVFIRDDGVTEASLSITGPRDASVFGVGETILIEARAIDLDGYLSRVEFRDGPSLIGVSEIAFLVAPEPGTPILHELEWKGAAPGNHTLTAHAVRADGTRLASLPVGVVVRAPDGQPPQVAITRPTSGSQWPLGSPVVIEADAVDPDGHVVRVEFFADGAKIGERNVVFIQPPEPGRPQTFRLVWRHPPPGAHTLQVRAIDDRGQADFSDGVGIEVVTPDDLPVVRLTVPDAWAVEPSPGSDPNTATFRIRRFGPTNEVLAVAFTLRGTAGSGADFESLAGWALIPAGQRSVTVTVRPLADDADEGLESVLMRLEDPPPVGPDPGATPTPYRVGFPRHGVAVISDPLTTQPAGRPGCLRLPGGWLRIGFEVEPGQGFRVEASTDLRNWDTVLEGTAANGAVSFVDEDESGFSRRFYRLIPEPSPAFAD